MNEREYSSLIRYLAEEMAHFKFGEGAVEYNTDTQTHEFTREVEHWIMLETEHLNLVFESYSCKPKINIITKFKNLLK